jgi:subtilisin-like proprotein convertase family protein
VYAYQNYSPSYNGSGQLTRSWQSDGRNTDPATVSFGDSRTAGLNSLLGSDPNGTWTLVFSDWVTSGDPSTLGSWSLNLTVIPEPTNIALGILEGSFLLWQAVRAWRQRVRGEQ